MLHVSQGAQVVNVKVDGGITVSLPYITIILVTVLFLLFWLAYSVSSVSKVT